MSLAEKTGRITKEAKMFSDMYVDNKLALSLKGVYDTGYAFMEEKAQRSRWLCRPHPLWS